MSPGGLKQVQPYKLANLKTFKENCQALSQRLGQLKKKKNRNKFISQDSIHTATKNQTYINIMYKIEFNRAVLKFISGITSVLC